MGVEPRERRALRLLARVAAWVVAVPVGLVGAGYVVQQGQTYRQHRLEDDRAHTVLTDWAVAVTKRPADRGRRFAPVGDLTGQDGDWEPGSADDDKQALLAGMVEGRLPTGQGPGIAAGVVRWADGVTATLPLLSAAQGLDAVRQSVPASTCPDCRPLVAVGAVLGLAEIDTDSGRATVPVWRYTIEGTGVVVTRVAIRPEAAATAAAREDTQSRSLRGVVFLDGWAPGPDARTITVGFSGADGPGSSPCGADYAGRAVESPAGVVLLVRQTSPSYWRQVGRIAAALVGGPASYSCPAYAVSRTVDVRLDAPLGDRTVLDVFTGTPLRRWTRAPV